MTLKKINKFLSDISGLSLLEISLAIMVMLILFSMTAPQYFKYLRKMKYLTSSREMQSGIKSSKEIARSNNTYSGVIIDPATETFYYSNDLYQAGDFPTGTVTGRTNDSITDSTKAWPVGKWDGMGIIILGTTGSPANKLYPIDTSTANTINSTGNFLGTSIGDNYIIIPLIKKQFLSGINIMNIQTTAATHTTRQSIVFKGSGLAYDSSNNNRDFCIHIESRGLNPEVQETIKVVGATGSVIKLSGLVAP